MHSSPRPFLTPGRVLACVSILLTLCLIASCYFRMLRATYVLCFLETKPRPLRVYDRFAGFRTSSTDISIPGAQGPIQLRLYLPVGKTHPAPILMVHGLVPYGNRDGYLDSVASHLAEMGYLVCLPNLPAETHFEMRPSDLTVIGDAIRWTAKASGEKVSVFGVSFGAGLAIPAALQPSVVSNVKLILSLSGYNDMESVGRYYFRETVKDPEGHPYRGEPPSPLIIAAPYLPELLPAQDLPALSKVVNKVISNRGRALSDTDPLLQRLSKLQRREYTDLASVGTPQMQQRYMELLVRHHQEMAAISPSSVLGRLSVPLFVLHGEDDPVFPEGEVEWMRKELAGNPNAHILVTPWLGHALTGLPATFLQKFQTAAFGAELLYRVSRPAPIAH